MSEAELGYRLEQSAIDQQLQRISASKYALVMSQAQDMGVVPFLKAYAPESNLGLCTDIPCWFLRRIVDFNRFAV